MTGKDIIDKFELNVDDQSTMSSQETLDLANKIYRQVLNYRPWVWLVKQATGTVSSQTASVPSDFRYFYNNYNDADGDDKAVIFVGSDSQPYEVIPFSERRNHRDNGAYCYYDAVNNTINFTDTSADGLSFEFDYVRQPDDLTTATSPVFPTRFHDIIYFGMAVDFQAIDNTPKQRSYSDDFQLKYDTLIEDMSYENSKLYGRASY